jgi:hypothetical protein
MLEPPLFFAPDVAIQVFGRLILQWQFYPHGHECHVLDAQALRAGSRQGASASFCREPDDLSSGGLNVHGRLILQ